MENMDVILTNGRVVTEKGIENCYIVIFEGKICALGQLNSNAKIIEDATDLIILPGGIDAHVNICLLYTSPSPRD